MKTSHGITRVDHVFFDETRASQGPPRLMDCYDPYDIWAFPTIGLAKVAATNGSRTGFLMAGATAVADFLCPTLLRRLARISRRRYAHVDALGLLTDYDKRYGRDFLALAETTAIEAGAGIGWGYPFDWYSKNAPGGCYRANSVPYVTVTPYVMEALLQIASDSQENASRAKTLFEKTWGFLKALRVVKSDSKQLALSYAPVEEPFLIVNANSYAAYAYAMHAKHGVPGHKKSAHDKAVRLAYWVVNQQHSDGAWWYVADSLDNNFIDCFHSCMTIKNLLKARRLVGADLSFVEPHIDRGWRFIREKFYDEESHLCRRFFKKGTKDPLYKWDIYDQAEYLGLLVDFQLLDEAVTFRAQVEKRFCRGADWFCRIDILGRPWGRNFLRWGIAPFWYNCARLEEALHTTSSE